MFGPTLFVSNYSLDLPDGRRPGRVLALTTCSSRNFRLRNGFSPDDDDSLQHSSPSSLGVLVTLGSARVDAFTGCPGGERILHVARHGDRRGLHVTVARASKEQPGDEQISTDPSSLPRQTTTPPNDSHLVKKHGPKGCDTDTAGPTSEGCAPSTLGVVIRNRLDLRFTCIRKPLAPGEPFGSPALSLFDLFS